jgi:pilus assembly protein Flp/PilA
MELMFKRQRDKFFEDDGQALVEYALILMLVALVVIGALTSIGSTVTQMIMNAASGF